MNTPTQVMWGSNSPLYWKQRAEFIAKCVSYLADNISTADLYEDEWNLQRAAAEEWEARR